MRNQMSLPSAILLLVICFGILFFLAARSENECENKGGTYSSAAKICVGPDGRIIPMEMQRNQKDGTP
jgi:hypothetical protein